MRSERHVILFLAVGLTACGDASETGGGAGVPVNVDDSAGVRIVEYAGVPEVEPPFAFAADPVYSYGAGAGDHPFASIWTGVLRGDGSAAVYDANNGDVVLLSPDGTFQTVLATRGRGPSDVGSLTAMIALGRDSLFFQDFLNTRFSLFAGDSLADTKPILPQLGQAFIAGGLDANGHVLMSSGSYRRGFPEEWLPGYMVRFDPDAGVMDTVATYDWVPFVPPDHLPRNPFGFFGIVLVAGGEFLYGRTDTPQLTWRRTDGSVRQIVRWDPEPVHPTEEHWELFANDLAATAHEYNPQAQTDSARAALVESMLRRYELDPGQPLPLFDIPIADDGGRVWLVEYSVPYQLTRAAPSYVVLSPDGEWLGRLTVPDGLRVLDVSGGRVLGVEMGEMDVETVVVYELVER